MNCLLQCRFLKTSGWLPFLHPPHKTVGDDEGDPEGNVIGFSEMGPMWRDAED
jgi:hypothetical protein